MSYNISVNRQEGYILLHLGEELKKEDIDAALKEILLVRRSDKLKNILCDQRQLTVPPNKITIFDAACRFADKPFLGMKLAIVREKIPEEMHFFETVATNRSGLVRVFDNDKEARNWLAL